MSLPHFNRTATAGKNIFISYREHDTAGETGRLADRLKKYFSPDSIFMDIDKIDPGADFTKVLSGSLEHCDIMLTVIGQNWIGKDVEKNTIRIQQDGDWVRTEISTALDRGITVVPVLVDGGQLPGAGDLPDDLQPLLMRQSFEISNRRWDYDTEQLIQFLIRSGVKPVKPFRPAGTVEKSWFQKNSWWLYILLGIAIVIAAVVIIGGDDSESASTQDNVTQEEVVADTTSANIDGTWEEHHEGRPFTFVLKQYEDDTIDGTAYYEGEAPFKVKGKVSKSDVEMDIEEYGKLFGTVSTDGQSITAEIEPINAAIEKVTLNRH